MHVGFFVLAVDAVAFVLWKVSIAMKLVVYQITERNAYFFSSSKTQHSARPTVYV